jgi:hypothetical protein
MATNIAKLETGGGFGVRGTQAGGFFRTLLGECGIDESGNAAAVQTLIIRFAIRPSVETLCVKSFGSQALWLDSFTLQP